MERVLLLAAEERGRKAACAEIVKRLASRGWPRLGTWAEEISAFAQTGRWPASRDGGEES